MLWNLVCHSVLLGDWIWGDSVCRVRGQLLWVCLNGQPFVGGVILVFVGTPDKAVFQHTRSRQAAGTFSVRLQEMCQVVRGP